MFDSPPSALAVVVVNYGSSALLEQNLVPLARSLAASGRGATIVVVDNLTDRDERARVTGLAAREGWLVELPAANLGFGAGINLGVERAIEAGATTFLLLNPDATISAADATALAMRSAAKPTELLSPRITRPDGSPWFSGADLCLDDGRIHSAARRQPGTGPRVEPWLSGACLVVSDTLWRLVDGFDAEYFLYWEDVDLSHRVQAAGGSVRVCSDLLAVHSEGGTQGGGHESAGGSKSSAYYYYSVRNRMLFAVRNLARDDVRQWRRRIVPIAYETLLQGGRRELLRAGRVIAAVRGVRDAAAIARRALRPSGRPSP